MKNQKTPTKTTTPTMEGKKEIGRRRTRWGYEVEENLNGPVMGTKTKQAMATDRRECKSRM
jgi:hypothetical protein